LLPFARLRIVAAVGVVVVVADSGCKVGKVLRDTLINLPRILPLLCIPHTFSWLNIIQFHTVHKLLHLKSTAEQQKVKSEIPPEVRMGSLSSLLLSLSVFLFLGVSNQQTNSMHT